MGLTETSRALYDPLGNFIPFRSAPDPRPPAGSYNSGSMSGLAASQANPDGYGVGCVLDGIPSPCNRVSQAIDRLPIKEASIHGLAVNPWIMRLMSSFQLVETRREETEERRLPPSETKYDDEGNPYDFHGLPPRNVTKITKEWVIAPGAQSGFEQNKSNKPQNTLIQDDPKTISSQGSKNCQFTISFESGTFYEGDRNLPNGPGEIQYKGRAYLGLGFTVSGTTRGGGGIGRIGGEVNPSNPKGQWALDQYTSNYSKQNGEFVTINGRVQQGGEAWRDIDLTGYHFATDWTNKFSRYDHPALRAGVPDTYKNQSFLIKVSRGKDVCQAEFHMIQRGNEIHWGRGAQGVWPR